MIDNKPRITPDQLIDKIRGHNYMEAPYLINALVGVVELSKQYKDEAVVNEEFSQGLHVAFELMIETIEDSLL